MNSLIVAFLLITALWSPQAFSENIETELKSLDGNTSTEARIRDPIVFKDSTGEAFWLKDIDFGGHSTKGFFWDPQSQKLSQIELPSKQKESSFIFAWGGLLFVGGDSIGRGSEMSALPKIDLLIKNSKPIKGQLQHARIRPHLISLLDNSILVLGGIVKRSGDNYNPEEVITNSMEKLTFSANKIISKRLPDLPGKLRKGYSALVLPNGDLMVAGGRYFKTKNFSGSTNEVYFFNFKKEQWTAGPSMKTGRAFPAANILPNGNVLIIGGLEAGPEEYNRDFSKITFGSSEIYDTQKMKFSDLTPLLFPIQRVKTFWFSEKSKTKLLALGTGFPELQYYDLNTNTWNYVLDTCGGPNSYTVLPLVIDNKHNLLFQSPDGKCPGLDNWTLIDIEQAYSANNSSQSYGKINSINGYNFFSNRTEFLPGKLGGPAFIIEKDYKENNQALKYNLRVYAVWSEGTYQEINRDPKTKKLYQEYLENEMRLKKVINPDEERIDEDLSVKNEADNVDSRITRKKLANGTIVVAGGADYKRYVAQLPDSDDEIDLKNETYIGSGDLISAATYTVYNPTSKKWTRSAAFDQPETIAQTIILDDGRVVIRTKESKLYISKENGKSWIPLEPTASGKIRTIKRIFVIDGELLRSGLSYESYLLVERFDFSTDTWDFVWKSKTEDENNKINPGKIILHKIGNLKSLVIPVEGY